MKTKLSKQNVCRLLLCLILVVSIALPSCDFSSMLLSQQTEATSAQSNNTSGTTTAPTTSNQPNQTTTQSANSGSSPSTGDNEGGTTTVIQNNIVINGGSGDVSYAAAIGLQSTVSVHAAFEQLNGTSSGSGIVYDLDAETGSAFIITNFHVVSYYSYRTGMLTANQIYICTYGMEYSNYLIPATYVGGSENYDVAVLRVENSEILKDIAANGAVRSADLANSDALAPGQTAIAIGNPESDGISVTTGIVSVASESLTMASVSNKQVTHRVIRIDTAVNHGNSGGGLFNSQGKLIGLVNAKIIKEDVENIGYAIPSNIVRAVADNIIDHCYQKDCKSVMRAMHGVTVVLTNVTTSYNNETGLIDIFEEVTVYEVSEGSLAYNILQENDIVKQIKIGDRVVEVTRQYQLIDAMLDARVGDTVSITVIRSGVEITLDIVITQDCLTAY